MESKDPEKIEMNDIDNDDENKKVKRHARITCTGNSYKLSCIQTLINRPIRVFDM